MLKGLHNLKPTAVLRGAGGVSGPSISGLSLAGNIISCTASGSAGGTAWYLVNASTVQMGGAAVKAAVQAASPQAYGNFAVSTGINNATMNLSGVTPGYAVLHLVIEKGGAFSAEAQFEFTYAPAAPLTFVQSAANSNQTFGTTVRIAAPAGIASGNMLVAAISTGAATTMSTPAAGWTLVGNFDHEGTGGTTWLYKKIAAGTEGGTNVDWVVAGSVMSAGVIYEISGASNVQWQTNAVDLDPPSITPASGSSFIIIAGVKQPYCGFQNVSAAPTGYGGFISARSDPAANASSSHLTVGAAHKAVSAASENPGVFTFTGTPDPSKRASFTVAVW